MFFIYYLHLFGINLDGTVSTHLGPEEYRGGKYLDNLKVHICPITSTSCLKHFVQCGEKGITFYVWNQSPSLTLAWLPSGGNSSSQWQVQKVGSSRREKKKNSPTKTLENTQSQKLRIGYIETEKPQTTHHSGHVLCTNYPWCYNGEKSCQWKNCSLL